MSELYEFVFEDVPEGNLHFLLGSIFEGGKGIKLVRSSFDELEKYEGHEIKIDSFINLILGFCGNAFLIVSMGSFDMGKASVREVILRVIEYSGRYDLDFNFDGEAIDEGTRVSLIKYIHEYMIMLSEKYEVGRWYGGLEPASDEDTRFFFNYNCYL